MMDISHIITAIKYYKPFVTIHNKVLLGPEMKVECVCYSLCSLACITNL